MKTINLEGYKYNLLKVLSFTGNAHSKRGKIYLCECKCGNRLELPTAYIRKGSPYSCGCEKRTRKDKGTRRGNRLNDERLYRTWKRMRMRCNNPNFHQSKDYGDRGIKVCEEWSDYLNFKKWALCNGYSEKLSIDRIDNNGDYSPQNCRWATSEQQSNNQRSNVLLTYKGETKTAAQWAKEIGITKSSMYHRLHRGWTVEEIITIPMGQKRTKSLRKENEYE